MKRTTEKYRGKRTARARRNWRNRPIMDWHAEVSAWRKAGDAVKFMALKYAKGRKWSARKFLYRRPQ